MSDQDEAYIEEEENDELFEHFHIIADKGQSFIRIDKFLFDRIPNLSRNKIQQAATAGNILVNTKVVKSNYRVHPLDDISFVRHHWMNYQICSTSFCDTCLWYDQDHTNHLK